MIWLDELAAHVDAARWDAALRSAIEQWRLWRAPELADLVDALSARCAAIALDARGDRFDGYGHHEWTDLSLTYDPVAVAPLIATIDQTNYGDIPRRALSPEAAARDAEIVATLAGGRSIPHRIAYAIWWPPDPRMTWVLLDWCERLALSLPRAQWIYEVGLQLPPLDPMVATIAEYMKALADERAEPRLRALVERSPGRSNGARRVQREIGRAGLDGLDAGASAVPLGDDKRARLGVLGDRVGRITRPEPKAPPSFAPDELWLMVAADPDDDAVRQVLADALLARADPRGQLFVLQLQHPVGRATGVVRDLIRAHWRSWLGDNTAHLVLRRHSVFERGMLETIMIGPGSMPSWRYDEAIGHRELLAVRTLRARQAAPADYARVAASLPNLTTIGVDSVAMATALAAVGPFPKVTTIERYHRDYRETIVTTLVPLTRAMPAVTAIRAHVPPTLEELAQLRIAFPKLARLILSLIGGKPLAERYDGVPDLEVEWVEPA